MEIVLLYEGRKLILQEDDGNTQVFALEDCKAVFSSYTEEPRAVVF